MNKGCADIVQRVFSVASSRNKYARSLTFSLLVSVLRCAIMKMLTARTEMGSIYSSPMEDLLPVEDKTPTPKKMGGEKFLYVA
jgi:hypothetical protein